MNLFNFCLVFQFFIQTSLGLEDEKKLQEHLISNYNRLVRPVEKNTDILDLKLGLKLIQILDIDEKNQILLTKVWVKHIWKDINLRWNPAEYANLTKVSIPSTSIWIPDIILFNSADGKYEISLMTRAKIDYEGNVVWEPPAIYKSHCTINVEFFPFDQQHCIMKEE
ncbi:unnamed protein product [Brachionus calyciflorus]|uniref:Neurotransmitter-gated ion-channel ligand-binding domain-containing protein n=1 Tax=Brachionus calyciflorus TaxID=104777 RepID=A0A813UKS9_9BILA|nr:unnamed protein product [Brachionus calyciflorus]